MNYFVKYENLHAALWNLAVEAGHDLVKREYWTIHYLHLWRLCFDNNFRKGK